MLALTRPGDLLGVWVRGCRYRLAMRGRRCFLLVGSDLGALLRRCERVAVRQGGMIVVLDAERLIAWRTLQIVTGTPYLPRLERLRVLYPELCIRGSRLTVLIGLGAPEAALAACAEARVPVVSSWIDYRG